MSKSQQPKQGGKSAAAAANGTKARVLVDCALGKPNDVVIVNESQLENGKKDGSLDDNADAVAYAESEGAEAVDKTPADEPALEE